MLVTIHADTKELDAQLEQIKALSTSKRAADFLESELPHLLDDLITSDSVPTRGAGGALQLVVSIKLGRRLDDLVATLRAMNGDSV